MTIINRIHKHRISQPGFTMIEALVSLSIIFVLINVFLVNYRTGNQKADLDMAAQKMVSDINLARSYALGLKEFKGGFPAGGWGIRFNSPAPSDNYEIFADINENYWLDNISQEKLTDIKISQRNVIIDQLDLYCQQPRLDRNYAYLVFTPPNPKITITSSQNKNNQPQMPTGVNNNCTRLEIYLKNTITSDIKKITINKHGLAEID